MRTYHSVAAATAAEKERSPEKFCSQSRCLWRIKTLAGDNPCRRHPVAQSAFEAELNDGLDEEFKKVRAILDQEDERILMDRLEESIAMGAACEVCRIPLGYGPSKCKPAKGKPGWCFECAAMKDYPAKQEIKAQDVEDEDRADYERSLGVKL